MQYPFIVQYYCFLYCKVYYIKFLYCWSLRVWQVMTDAPHVAPLISFLLTLFFVNVLLKSSRDDIIYQRPSFAKGIIVLAATFPRISHRKFVRYGKSMLRHRYYTRKYLFILFLLIPNDIQLNPGPLNSSTLKSCSLNARSIVNKRMVWSLQRN